MDPKEDEIPIDFSKIKNFFKSDKKEEATVDTPIANKEKEDEISIDFSKIKNFFKSNKKEEKHKEESVRSESKKDDEELDLSFDASRIKKFFKFGEKSESSDEDIQINWNKIRDFFKNYGVVFIVLIPIILSIYVRMQAGFLPFADDWAANNVINSYRSNVKSQIDSQFPNLPEQNKNEIVNREFQNFLNANKAQLDKQIKDTSTYIKSFFQDDESRNYMPDIDPYYWFRYAKNIVEHGHPGDTLKDNKPYDNHQLAPIGRFVQPDIFHAYFLAYFYKFLKLFAPSLTLMRSLFYYPVFVSGLAVLLVFLIARKIVGNFGGFFAALIMAVNQAFLGRTLFGHADSDAWVVFFPLLITWLFVVIIDAKSMTKIVVLTVIASFFTGLYTIAWSGWWYVFDFLLITMAFEFLYLFFIRFELKDRNFISLFSDTAIRNILTIGIIYFMSTFVFVGLISGWDMFRGSFLGPLSFPSIKAPVRGSIWPNVLTTVAELNEGSVNGIINSVGGSFLFFISLAGLVLAISRKEGLKKFDFIYIIGSALFYGSYFAVKRLGFEIPVFGLLIWIVLPVAVRIVYSVYKKDSSYDFKLSILLSLWMISTIFASIKGIRFTLLLAPAFSVAFGVALGATYYYASNFLVRELKIHKVIGKSILIIVLLLIYINPIRGAISVSSSDVPLINDAWYNDLLAIKQNSNQTAIITSWWDFGHHFKALADRPVTFDGTTQTHPASHWVGRLFMTSNESEAMGILRMLDCGSNTAYNELYKITNDTHLSLKILKKIILLNRSDAEKELRKSKLDSQQTEKILSLTHCEPPEAFVIASEDMIGKSGVWSHFGSWNFERADIWLNARKMSQEDATRYMMGKFNYTKERAENTYFEIQAITSDGDANSWVAPWPGYGGTFTCSKNSEQLYVCPPLNVGNNIALVYYINLSNYDIFAPIQKDIVRPSEAAFTTEDGLFFKKYQGTTTGHGLTIIPKNENVVEVIVSSRELTGSMFTRMFYLQGHGLKYFKLFNHQHGLTGTDIYTYKVDWEGKNATIVEEYLKKIDIDEKLNDSKSIIANNSNNS